MELVFSIDDVKVACRKVWSTGSKYKVWAFYGEMGTGKTTFIHNLCEMLGVTSAVSSPTYAIINEYESSEIGIIYHMDWYRLKDEQEAIEAGVEDALFSGNFCLVEWPEKAKALLPETYFEINLQLIDATTRRITFENYQSL